MEQRSRPHRRLAAFAEGSIGLNAKRCSASRDVRTQRRRPGLRTHHYGFATHGNVLLPARAGQCCTCRSQASEDSVERCDRCIDVLAFEDVGRKEAQHGLAGSD